MRAENSSDVWAPGVKPYIQYFRESRAAPPPDTVASETLNEHEPYPEASSTHRITCFDPSALQHTLGTAALNTAFVMNVLQTTGPVITVANGSSWSFSEQPPPVHQVAQHEADYYDWFNWAVCWPAANAVNAVRDRLYEAAHVTVPVDGYSRTDIVHWRTGGVIDIMHHWSSLKGHAQRPCTPHEFKRCKVLRVGDQSVLDYLVEKAGAQSGYDFRSREPISTLPGMAKNIVSQVINEMISTDTGHAIICTQEQYVMLRVTDSLQLEISPVYAVRGSATQAMDTTLLVLFYTHATLRAGKTYAPATTMRVTLPVFPTSVFQPYEGVFRGGAIGRTKLVSKFSGSFFPLPWAWFDGKVRSSSNDVTIAYGRLILLFVASRSLVAKTAHGPSATQRLVCEYNAYTAMRTLQGTVIPTVMGMFTTKDGKNTVLMMSYAGEALKTFSDLRPDEKLMLFHRLVRLHKTGVQHNDLEPRNVTKSSSGPLIIDFDNASLDHSCPGASCQELLLVAQALDLDPTAETKTLEQETSAPPTVYSIVLAFVSAVVSAVFGFSRHQRDD